MRCKKAEKLISEYVDGDLDERQAAELEKHLAVCPECRELLKDFKGLVREARSLKTVVPSDAVWGRITGALAGSRIEESPRTPASFAPKPVRPFFLLRPAWALAAALLLVAVGGLVFLRPWVAGAPSNLTERDRYTLAKLDEAESYYRQAIKALGEAAAAQKGSLDPKVEAAFERNLSTVDRSIRACQAAVRHDPYNVENQNFLLAAYKDKVDILTDLISVKKESVSAPVSSLGTSL